MFTALSLFATPIAIMVHSKKKLGKISWGWAIVSFLGSMMALSQQSGANLPGDAATDLGSGIAIFILWFGVYLIGVRKKLRQRKDLHQAIQNTIQNIAGVTKNPAKITQQQKIDNIQLREYLERLRNVYREHGSFLDEGPGEAEACAIGNEINDAAGFAGMVKVCETYRDTVDRIQARALEKAWDGIGSWRG